jgi:tetratricopeptide (TPR) repeat protein
MVNPAKLLPRVRDDVCAQCHLSGEARTLRLGKRMEDYRPGAPLSDYAAYFVYDKPSALKATSHVEKLAASLCKRVSGERLWCGVCHDPHRLPATADRAAWFREKCLGCHQASQCKRGQDCVACHMPKGRVVDGGHGVLTDHSIPRRPAQNAAGEAGSWRLRGFSRSDGGVRELGLAYAEVFLRTGDARQRGEAVRLLQGADDPEALVRLADLYERGRDAARAAPLYQAALRKNVDSVVALVNLGRLYGGAGKIDDAIVLWREALKRNPCVAEARLNLTIALRAKGDTSAIDVLRREQGLCVFE